MQALQKRKDNPFGNSKVVFFGYDTFDAAKNMAVDELLKEKADKENRFFVRFYNVSRPSIILGSEDHYDLVKSANLNGCDMSRRITGGRPIYLDENTLQYSIAGPLRGGLNGFPREIHKRFGLILAESIEEAIGDGHEISLPRSSSIRIDGKPIAGHGQSISQGHSFLYHGVVVVYPWNLTMINALLHVDSKDFEELRSLPNLKDLGGDGTPEEQKEELVGRMMAKLPPGQLVSVGADEREAIISKAASLSASKYSNPKWVFRDDIKLRRDAKFCILYEGELTEGD